MDRRAVGPTARIYEWLESHEDGERWDGLLAWILAVSLDPDAVTSEAWHRPGSRREVRASMIPRARTCAIYIVVDTPARAIHVIQFRDDLYEEREGRP